MNSNDEQLFSDEQIQRFDADTIKHRYGENWRNYASNVREVKQADGSIVREYIIEDPSLLKEINPSIDSTSSSTSSDDEQQTSKHKFAQIKAKFEQKSFTNVMASPSSSSVASSHTNTRRSASRQVEDANVRNRRDSNDSLSNNRTNFNIPPAPPIANDSRSQTISTSSFRRFNPADEADEEVQRIHRQGSDLRQHQTTLTPISSMNETTELPPPPPPQANVQYEVVDEDGNPMAIDGVHDLIKMSGVTAREVPQPDGTLVREYVIDDPTILSKFQSRVPQDHIPPPPPRVPLKQSVLFRQEPSSSEFLPPLPPVNLQQVRQIEVQRLYEFTASSGKRIEFMITSLGADESDVQELTTEMNNRLIPPSSNPAQQPFTLPKQWHPAVDLTQREQPSGSNKYNHAFQQQGQLDPTRSGSYQQQFAPVFAEPIIDWSAVRQQDPHGQIDPQFIQQYITQKHQSGGFQTSAQFLPEQQQQPVRSNTSPSRTNIPIYYQQPSAYPYQGQQQHGVQILPSTTDLNYHPQQIANGHTRI